MKITLFILACLLASIQTSPINVSLQANTAGLKDDKIPVEIKPVKLEIKVAPKKDVSSTTTTEAAKVESTTEAKTGPVAESKAAKVEESPVETKTDNVNTHFCKWKFHFLCSN